MTTTHPTDALADARTRWPDLFDEAGITKVRVECSRMAHPLTLQLQLDDSPASADLRTMMRALADLAGGNLDIIGERVGDLGMDGHRAIDITAPLPYATPMVRVLRTDGRGMLEPAGLAFHGVPAGLQFHPFVMALFNASGAGQPLTERERTRIDAIHDPVDIMLLVSLAGEDCAHAAHAAQRIAAANDNVRAEAYDLALYPALREEYDVQQAPCLVLNRDGMQHRGSGVRNVERLLDEIDRI